MTMSIDLACALFENAAKALADAEEARMRNEIAKAEYEAQLAATLIGSPNPMTGRAHSNESATKAAAQDARTVEYREERIALERAVTLAKAQYKIREAVMWMVVHTAGRVEVPGV